MYVIVVLKLQIVEASTLSWGTRIKGFIACFAIGILCSLLVRFPSIHCLFLILCFILFLLPTFLFESSLNWMDKVGVGAVGGKESSCVPLVGVALLCYIHVSCSSPSRVLFCCGCLGMNWASLQCFTPWVTWHQLGGNLSLFSFFQPCYLLDDKISIMFEGGEEECFISLRSWEEGGETVGTDHIHILLFQKTFYILVYLSPLGESRKCVTTCSHVRGL